MYVKMFIVKGFKCWQITRGTHIKKFHSGYRGVAIKVDILGRAGLNISNLKAAS